MFNLTASSGLRENVILTKIILTTNVTKIFVKRDRVPGNGIHNGRTILIRDVDVICVPPTYCG